jgi:hypothetical protein
MATAMNLSPTTILRLLHAEDGDDGTITYQMVTGLDGKVRPSRRFNTADRDRQIRVLRRTGKSIRAIAADVGCSVGTVHRVLKSG